MYLLVGINLQVFAFIEHALIYRLHPSWQELIHILKFQRSMNNFHICTFPSAQHDTCHESRRLRSIFCRIFLGGDWTLRALCFQIKKKNV